MNVRLRHDAIVRSLRRNGTSTVDELAEEVGASRRTVLRDIGALRDEGVVCGKGRNPTLRLWPAIFSGEIDVFPGDRRSRLISSMTSVAPA